MLIRNYYSYHPCEESFSFYKAKYKIYDRKTNNKIAEGEIDENFGKSLATTKNCRA